MTDEAHVSIGQVKRDISELINRVAYAGERIVLTSHGKPKAALVSMEDYEWLARSKDTAGDVWRTWLDESAQLGDKIRKRRQGASIDVDTVWQAARTELEGRAAAGR